MPAYHYDHPPKSDSITTTSENTHLANIIVDHWVYEFSVEMLSEDDRKWLLGVVGEMMREIHARAILQGREEVQQAIRKALNVK